MLGTTRQFSNRLKKSSQQKIHRAMVETLEERRLFATVSWITAGSGDWSNGANWSTGSAPAQDDDVIIDIPGLSIAVTYSGGGTIRPHNLLLNEVLAIRNGSTLGWTGGTWRGAGVIDIGSISHMDISGSSEKVIKDGLFLFNAGTVASSGTGRIRGEVGARIENVGLWDAQSDADITFTSGVGDGFFINTGTFRKSGGTDVTEIGGQQGFTFLNEGLVEINTGTLALGDNQNVANYESADSGANANSMAGDFVVASGATLDFVRGTIQIVPDRAPPPGEFPTITGAGTVRVSGASVSFWGTYDVFRTEVTGGSLLFQQNKTDPDPSAPSEADDQPSGLTDELLLSGGLIGGNGAGVDPTGTLEDPALIVSDDFLWTGGGMTGDGRIVIAETATSVISGAAPKTISAGTTGAFILDLFGITDWFGDGIITLSGDSRLWIQNGGSLRARGNGTITSGSGGGQFWNEGDFIKQDGTGVTTINGTSDNTTYPEFFRNIFILRPLGGFPPPFLDPNYISSQGGLLGARVDVLSGTLALGGETMNGQTILIHPNATLAYTDGSHTNTNAGEPLFQPASILGVDGGGTLELGNAVFTSGPDALVDVPTTNFGTGNYLFENPADGGQVVHVGTLTDGTITGTGTLKITGMFNWNSGTIVGITSQSSLLLDTSSTFIIPGGDRILAGGHSLENRGSISWTSTNGTLSVTGNYTQTTDGTLGLRIDSATAFDRLAVTGQVVLDGILDLDIDPAFIPTVGMPIVLISNAGADAVVGTFDGLTEGSLITDNGRRFALSYAGGDGNDVTLTPTIFPEIAIADAQVVEGNSGTTNLDFTVTLAQAVQQTVTVNYATANGTATAGSDYTANSGTLTFDPGETAKTITIAVTGETALEADETLLLNLSSPVNGQLGADTQAVGTIIDDDNPSIVSFSSATYSVLENATTATITVTRSSAVLPLSVDYTASAGSATAATDFTPVSGTLTFSAGISSLTFDVSIINNTTPEANETILLSLANVTGGQLGTTAATLTVVDDDVPFISIADASGFEEGTGPLVFTLTLSQASDLAVSVPYSTSSGTAVAGADFVANAGTITFNPGETTKTISVAPINDALAEGAETFTIDLGTPTNANLGNAQAIGTIGQDTGVFGFTAANYTIGERVGLVTLTITRTGGTDGAVSVAYATVPGTATAGEDYVATSGVLNFSDGESAKAIQLTVVNDPIFEPVETFSLALSSPSGASQVGVSAATVSITSDDPLSGIFAVATRNKAGVVIRTSNTATSVPLAAFTAYAGKVSGDVRLAVADMNGDGNQDVLAVRSKDSTEVTVFDGVTGTPLTSFFAFAPGTKDQYIATGDVNGDGTPDVIVTAAKNSAVAVFDGTNFSQIAAFNAFPKSQDGGIAVASGDVNDDGHDDIIIGGGKKSNRVEIFDGVSNALIADYDAYTKSNKEGIYVSSGDIDGNGVDDVVTIARKKNRSTVNVFVGASATLMAQFSAFGSSFSKTAAIAVGSINGDGRDDIIVTAPIKKKEQEIRRFRSPVANDFLISSSLFDSSDIPFIAAG